MKQKVFTYTLCSMLSLVLVSTLPVAFTFYLTMQEAEEEKLIDIAHASLKPIVNLASNSVNGANVMKLRNDDAKNLYEFSDLLYLDIEGMSKEVPATEFSPKQRAMKITYTYSKEGLGSEVDRLIVNNDATFLDKRSFLLILVTELEGVENGGKITAVFSAESLKDIKFRIQKKIIPIVTAILFFASILAYFLASLIARSILDPSGNQPDKSIE